MRWEEDVPTRRLRKRLVDRALRGLKVAGEFGLACLMTAGVMSCGGTQTVGSGDAATDGPVDGTPPPPEGVAEAAYVEGGTRDVFVEAANVEGGTDSGSDTGGVMDSGDGGPIVEACCLEGGFG